MVTGRIPPELIPSTDPNLRYQQIMNDPGTGRPDPFSPIVTPGDIRIVPQGGGQTNRRQPATQHRYSPPPPPPPIKAVLNGQHGILSRDKQTFTLDTGSGFTRTRAADGSWSAIQYRFDSSHIQPAGATETLQGHGQGRFNADRTLFINNDGSYSIHNSYQGWVNFTAAMVNEMGGLEALYTQYQQDRAISLQREAWLNSRPETPEAPATFPPEEAEESPGNEPASETPEAPAPTPASEPPADTDILDLEASDSESPYERSRHIQAFYESINR